MGIELTGKIHAVFETKQVSEKFRKREFVLETNDNPKYPQTVLFEMTGDRCEQLNEIAEGDEVRVEFSVRGREWHSPKGETKYFNSLDVWKVERVGAAKPKANGAPPAPQTRMDAAPEFGAAMTDDDIPFATCSIDAEPSPIARILR